MTEPKPSEAGCGVMLAFLIGEIVAAVAFGYCTYRIGTAGLGWLPDNAVPVSMFAGLIGAFLVDRWAKSVIGHSTLFGIFSMIPTV